MNWRIGICILGLTACAGTTPPPPVAAGPDRTPAGIDDTPFSARIVSHRTSHTTAMGQLTTVTMDLDYLTEITPNPSAPAPSVRVVIGQKNLAAGQVFDMVTPADLTGLEVVMPLDERGRLGDYTVPDERLMSDVALGQLMSVLRQFFPTVPREGILPSSTWSDTTQFERAQTGADIRISAVTDFAASDWTDTTASRVLAVQWSRVYTITGSGEQLGMMFTVDGSGVSSGTHLFGPNGRYLGTTVMDSSTSDFAVPSMGISSPLTQVGADTIQVEH